MPLRQLLGWTIEMPEPLPARCVIIGAPHTSNWDLVLAFLFMFATGTKIHWIGKDTLFRGPFGPIFRGIGGIPIDRSARANVVEQMVGAFRSRQKLRLAIAPEGTRRSAPHWKSGFYYIAWGAGVPIVLGYADYRRRAVGVGPTIHPTGDIQADFERIRAFYADIVGRHPEHQGMIQLRSVE